MDEKQYTDGQRILGEMKNTTQPKKTRYDFISQNHKQIKKLKEQGYTYKQIAEQLKKGGIDVSASMISKTMLKIKQQQKNTQKTPRKTAQSSEDQQSRHVITASKLSALDEATPEQIRALEAQSADGL